MNGTAGTPAQLSTGLPRKPSGKTDIADIALGTAAFLIPFISWGQIPWITGPFVLVVAAGLLIVLKEAVKKGNIQVPAGPVWVPLAMALCLALGHLPFSPVPYSSLLSVIHLLLFVAFYFLWWARVTVLSPDTLVLLWTGVLIPWIAVQKVATGPLSPGGPFLNPNYTATVLLVCMAMALGSAASSREGQRRTAVMLTAAVLNSAGLMIIGSRSAGLGMILLWAAYLILRKDRLRWIAIAAMAVILLMPNTIRYRVTEGYKTDPHAFTRLQIWGASIRMGMDHPIIGVGPGLFYDYGPVYAFPTEELPVRYGRIVRKPHNEYLRIWAEGGFVGLGVLALFMIAVLRMTVHAFREGRAGPVLSTAIIFYQALFHDITEVLALIILFSWCLAQLTPVRTRTLEVGKGAGRALTIAVGSLMICLSVMISLDLASRSLWLKGKRLMDSDIETAVRTLRTATVLNPLLPGAGRDLALGRLMISRRKGTEDSWEKVERDTMKARGLNRLDSIPLRLRASLYTDIARQRPGTAAQALALAAGELEAAARLEPHNALILLSLSGVYWDLGQREKAMDLIEGALEKEPNYLEAHRVKLSRLSELAPERIKEAEFELSRARERAEDYRPVSEYEKIILR